MEQIIQRFKEGDQEAFELLFRAFFPAGRRFVRSFLADDQAADDQVQDVFLQIWNRRRMFQDERHFKAYFYKSLRNNTIKYITRHRQTQGLDIATGIKAEDILVKIMEVEFSREIARAVSLLPEKRRQIILHTMAGMSVEEIAAALNISVNTVKAQKRQAYSSLREELKDVESRILSILL